MLEKETNNRRTFLANSALGMGAAVAATMPRTVSAAAKRRGLEAGAAERDITPPVGMEITHYIRENIGVHDPLHVRAVLLRDRDGQEVALVSGDLIGAGFACCDELRERVKAETGVDEVWFSCSHTHAGRWLVSTPVPGREYTEKHAWDEGTHVPITERPEERSWNDSVHKKIVDTVRQAKEQAEPAVVKAGKAPVQVGFNRRITGADGHTYMGVNREGVIVPWTSILSAESLRTGKPIFVLFEHAAHPVTVPHTSKLISADYPGAAVAKIRKSLGGDCIAAFGQGCSGNINSFPLRSTHSDAQAAGNKLGEAVLVAMGKAQPVSTDTLRFLTIPSLLPTQPLPSEKLVAEQMIKQKEHPLRIAQLKKIVAKRASGTPPDPRRFDVHGLMLGDDFCLVSLPYEHFSHTERWVDRTAPFGTTMTFSLTNGGRGYIGSDEGLALGKNGGYEAGALPNWSAHEVMSPNLGGPAVGSEQIIRGAISALWA